MFSHPINRQGYGPIRALYPPPPPRLGTTGIENHKKTEPKKKVVF